MEKSTMTTATPTTAPATTTSTATPATPAPTAPAAAPATAPATTAPSGEELCGSANILDTVHLKNLVDDLAKLYGTCVNTKVARDTKIAAEKRLIEAIRANLDRYED
ncbi:MAG: hypothetical protein K2L02_03620 [Clostridia bacterium]|nr:hypothetical protein [Clostridia bacterium]